MNGNPIQMIQMLLQSRNPQQMMQNMVQNNPKMKSAFDQMNSIFAQAKQKGMNQEQAVRQYAKQNNINIDAVIDNAKKWGAKF